MAVNPVQTWIIPTETLVNNLNNYRKEKETTLVTAANVFFSAIQVPGQDLVAAADCGIKAGWGIGAGVLETSARFVGIQEQANPKKYNLHIEARRVVECFKYFTAFLASFTVIVIPLTLFYPTVMLTIHKRLGLQVAKVKNFQEHLQAWADKAQRALLTVSPRNRALIATTLVGATFATLGLAWLYRPTVSQPCERSKKNILQLSGTPANPPSQQNVDHRRIEEAVCLWEDEPLYLEFPEEVPVSTMATQELIHKINGTWSQRLNSETQISTPQGQEEKITKSTLKAPSMEEVIVLEDDGQAAEMDVGSAYVDLDGTFPAPDGEDWQWSTIILTGVVGLVFTALALPFARWSIDKVKGENYVRLKVLAINRWVRGK